MFLLKEATAQKDAVASYLGALHIAGPVRFETREQAYRRFAEVYANEPALVAQTTPEDMPESDPLAGLGHQQ